MLKEKANTSTVAKRKVTEDARDILGEFGPESPSRPNALALPTAARWSASRFPYKTPVGPMGLMHKGVDVGGTNHGTCGTQGRH